MHLVFAEELCEKTAFGHWRLHVLQGYSQVVQILPWTQILPVPQLMVFVLCWRQQLQRRLPWRRHVWPGWVRYQHAWQNEATSMFLLVEFISADSEHM